MPDVIDLDLARRRREERRDIALLEMFSAVLRTPLERRELTPEQVAARDARLQSRRRGRSSPATPGEASSVRDSERTQRHGTAGHPGAAQGAPADVVPLLRG